MAKTTIKDLAAVIETQDSRIGTLEAEVKAISAGLSKTDAKLDKILAALSNQAPAVPADKAKGKAKGKAEKSSSINPEPAEIVWKKEPAKKGNGYKIRIYTPEIPYPALYKSFKNNGWSFIDGAWQHFYSDEHVEQAEKAIKCYRPATPEEKKEIESWYTKNGQPKKGTMERKARKNAKKNTK